MSFRKSLPVLVLLAALRANGLGASGHFPISRDQVAEAVRNAGIVATTDQVSFLADVVATSPSPILKVQSIESWGDHRLRVRCACSTSRECLPFFVSVNSNSAAQTLPNNDDHDSSGTHLPSAKPQTAGVRSGSAATLLIEADHAHIQIPVICLESGAPGKTIRVSTTDHRRTYMAEVVTDSLLKRRM